MFAAGCISTRDAASTGPRAQAAPAPVASAAVDEVAAEVVKRVNERDAVGVHALYGKRMQARFPEDGTRRFVSDVVDAMGRTVSAEKEASQEEDRTSYYLHGERADGKMEIAVGRDGLITLLRITSARKEPRIAQSTVPLVLPFRGQWFVDWGGNTPADNHHVGHGSQRRAADIVIRGADARTHRGDGKANTDYLAYGADVLAVADGTVTTVVNGVPENAPGVMNRDAITGNSVTIRHTDSLYSLYAHLQPGKMRVQVGATVKAGTVIGACGNSGNSSEPHLHFQLQDGPQFQDSWGVEAVFAGVFVTRGEKGERMAQYTFRKGDLVGELDTAGSQAPAR
jgi:murein DD-endopeptidase MepM/ murein hydrolase activator NlpD